MDRSRLKTVIISILVLLNAFLLTSILMQRNAEQTTHRRLEQQFILLFAADGMTMEEGTLPMEQPSTALTVTRDSEREQKAAVFFLGENLTRDEQSGGVVAFLGEKGTATFREDGSFEISGLLAEEDVEARCRTFCKNFSYSEPSFRVNIAGDGSGSAEGRYEKRQVVGVGAEFRVEGGALTTVSGTLLPANGVPAAAEAKMLSASAALTEFQKTRRETAAVVSVVSDVTLCYRLQRSAAAPMLLMPAWCIVTDTSNYYVNCSTGAVTTD